jgi:hypothetical protein
MPGEVVVAARRGDLQPRLEVPGGDLPQHRVDEPGRPRASDVLGEVHRRGDRGVGADPGGQQLVRAQPEHLAQRRVDPVQVPVAADGEDGVVAALTAQRAVGQLGGERRIPSGQPTVSQQRRQQQVDIGVPVGNRA